MTSQELLDGLANAGVTSQAQITELFSSMIRTAEIKSIDAAIDSLRAKRQEVLAPINNEEIELINKRQSLIDALPKPK